MSAECEICRRLPLITPESPYFLAELDTGFAVLGDHQIYDGYSLFIAKKCVPELKPKAVRPIWARYSIASMPSSSRETAKDRKARTLHIYSIRDWTRF